MDNNSNNNNDNYSFYNFFIDNNEDYYISNNFKRKLYNNNIKNKNKKQKYNKNETKNTYDESKLREPTSFEDIQNLPDKEEWLKAVQEELDNMTNLKVYNIVKDIPENATLITTRWVFKYKRDSNGKIIKRKARLVARGYTQEFGNDFRCTYAPSLKMDTLRIFISISINLNFKIKQIDINSAYLNAPLKERNSNWTSII